MANLVNILSVYQTVLKFNSLLDNWPISLKTREAETLGDMIEFFRKNKAKHDAYNGYYVGYSIAQISKEFDLLRFSDDLVINIELKSELNMEKISKQMNQNHYFLKFIGCKVLIFTFVLGGRVLHYANQKIRRRKLK